MVSKEELDVNDWINILYQAWNKMLNYYARLGAQGGYYHSREEDMRSFLFCQILDIIDKKKLSFLDLHTEVSLASRQRADITLGWIDEKHCKLAVEIKPHQHIEKDVEKLVKLIEDGNVEAGTCVATVERKWRWDEYKKRSVKPRFRQTDIYRDIETKFRVDQKNQGNNNFVKWRHVKREWAVGTENCNHIEFDAMFLVLRKARFSNI